MNCKSALVVAATGALGFELVRALRGHGVRVRAGVRPGSNADRCAALEALGAALVPCDLRLPETLAKACTDIDVVVSSATAIRTASTAGELDSVDGRGHVDLIAAARHAGVRRFVFVSFPPVPVDYALQRAKRRVEAVLVESGLEFCVLRPAKFVETWLSRAFGFDPTGDGVQIFGSGDRPVSWVSRLDVATHAAAAAIGPGFTAPFVPVAAPEPLSLSDAVRAAEAALSCSVHRRQVPEDALVTALQTSLTPGAEAVVAGRIALARGQCIDDRPTHVLPLAVSDIAAHISRACSSRTHLAGA